MYLFFERAVKGNQGTQNVPAFPQRQTPHTEANVLYADEREMLPTQGIDAHARSCNHGLALSSFALRRCLTWFLTTAPNKLE